MTLSNSFSLTSVFSVFKKHRSDVQDTQSTYSGAVEEKILVEDNHETESIGENEGMIPVEDDSDKFLVTRELECETMPVLSPATTSSDFSFDTHFTERTGFFQLLPKLLSRQCELGNLAASVPLKTTKKGSVLWTMTEQGMHAVLEVYGDIKEAIDHFGVSEEIKMSIGLRIGVTVEYDSNLHDHTPTLHERIGSSWPLPVRTALLKDPNANPFLYGVHIPWYQWAQWAMGVLKKAERSDGFADLLIPRLLGLAQLCGIRRLTFSDVMELTALAPYFEKIARSHVARVVERIDKSEITNLAYSNSINGQALGSTLYLRLSFPVTASSLGDKMVQIGEIRNRKVAVMYPKPLEDSRLIGFGPNLFPVKNGEPVYMLSGWATSLTHRPPLLNSSDGLQCLYRDIHCSPHYAEWNPDKVIITVRRTISGFLAGRPSRFGPAAPPNVSGQGIFGVPCGCTTPDPAKYLRIHETTTVNGVELNRIQEPTSDISHHDLRYIWTAGDLLLQRFRADAYPQSTYIQVPGECLYCTVNRAMGTGCSVLILGGFPKRPSAVCEAPSRKASWNPRGSRLPIAELAGNDASRD